MTDPVPMTRFTDEDIAELATLFGVEMAVGVSEAHIYIPFLQKIYLILTDFEERIAALETPE